MLPSVLTAKRSAPLQGRGTGVLATGPSHLPQGSPPVPSQRSFLCRSPQPRAALQDTVGPTVRRPRPQMLWEADPGPVWCPLALDPVLKPGRRPAVSTCVSRLLAPIHSHEHAQQAHLPGGGCQDSGGPREKSRAPRQLRRAAGSRAHGRAERGPEHGWMPTLERRGVGLSTAPAPTHHRLLDCCTDSLSH